MYICYCYFFKNQTHICKECGKKFKHSSEYAYVCDGKYFCSYTCYSKYIKNEEAKIWEKIKNDFDDKLTLEKKL